MTYTLSTDKAYAVLGLNTGASAAEVNEAYRKQSKKYHPSHNPDAHAQYMEVQHANDVLTAKHNPFHTQSSAVEKTEQQATSWVERSAGAVRKSFNHVSTALGAMDVSVKSLEQKLGALVKR